MKCDYCYRDAKVVELFPYRQSARNGAEVTCYECDRGTSYWIPLEELSTAQGVRDWERQLGEKSWHPWCQTPFQYIDDRL